jgi:hypothetical protein
MGREALGFLTEDQKIAGMVAAFQVGSFGLFAEEVQFFQVSGGQKGFKVFPIDNLDLGPIIEAGSLQITVVGAKTQRVDQMKYRVGSSAKAGDTAGIGRDFRFDQNDVERAGKLQGVESKQAELLPVSQGQRSDLDEVVSPGHKQVGFKLGDSLPQSQEVGSGQGGFWLEL